MSADKLNANMEQGGQFLWAMGLLSLPCIDYSMHLDKNIFSMVEIPLKIDIFFQFEVRLKQINMSTWLCSVNNFIILDCKDILKVFVWCVRPLELPLLVVVVYSLVIFTCFSISSSFLNFFQSLKVSLAAALLLCLLFSSVCCVFTFAKPQICYDRKRIGLPLAACTQAGTVCFCYSSKQTTILTLRAKYQLSWQLYTAHFIHTHNPTLLLCRSLDP